MDRILSNDKHAIGIAGNAILYGGVIVYPTDTLYGFGVDARNENAINKLNKIKNRTGPISVVAPDLATVLSWTTLEPLEWDLVKQYLRGKTTIILPVKDGIVHPKIMGEGNTLGIRIPADSFGPLLTHKLGFPITTTSVNKTDQLPLNDPKKIEESFGNYIDILIDKGPLPESRGSTIYKLEKSKLVVVRSGSK